MEGLGEVRSGDLKSPGAPPPVDYATDNNPDGTGDAYPDENVCRHLAEDN